ncbi:MAG: SRPBCC domain-containing protein [Chloroflexota bacterium]
MATPTKETTSVTVTRTINASAERLYNAFTSRDELNRWFCNTSFVNAQENGHYLVIWTQEQYSATGQFKEVVENEKLVMSWRSTWEGQESEYGETLTITFSDDDDGTDVTFYHEGMPEEGKQSYEWQWNKRLDDLKLYIETGALPNIVNRVIIGIYPSAVDEETAEAVGLEAGTYAEVARLVPNYGAEKAGILVGDVITHMNGEKVSSSNPMNMTVADNKPGDEVEVTLVRDGETLTLSMPLSPYPVPDMPENLADLAEQVAPQYDAIMEQLHDIFDGVSEELADSAPADGEWNAKMVLAHLIYSERYIQETTGSFLANGSPQHWSGNDNSRLGAIVAVNPTVNDMLNALRHAYDETLALWRNFPQETQDNNATIVWSETFGIQGWIQHTQTHMPQIQEAIASAQG